MTFFSKGFCFKITFDGKDDYQKVEAGRLIHSLQIQLLNLRSCSQMALEDSETNTQHVQGSLPNSKIEELISKYENSIQYRHGNSSSYSRHSAKSSKRIEKSYTLSQFSNYNAPKFDTPVNPVKKVSKLKTLNIGNRSTNQSTHVSFSYQPSIRPTIGKLTRNAVSHNQLFEQV